MSLKLGEMLVSNKVITEAQLSKALETQQQVGGKLGVIITKLRFLSEEQIAKFLGEQLKIPVLDLKDLTVQKDVSMLVDAEVLQKHLVLPIRRTKDSLQVAAVDPMDLDGLDELSFLTGLKIEPAVATRSNVGKAIEYYFRGKACPELQAAEKAKGIVSGEHSAIKDGSTRASPQAVLQALTELLIEKKIITQEELLNRVAGKTE